MNKELLSYGKKMEKNYGKRRKQLWNTNDKIYGEKMETTMEHKRNKTWTKWNKLWTQNGKNDETNAKPMEKHGTNYKTKMEQNMENNYGKR